MSWCRPAAALSGGCADQRAVLDPDNRDGQMAKLVLNIGPRERASSLPTSNRFSVQLASIGATSRRKRSRTGISS